MRPVSEHDITEFVSVTCTSPRDKIYLPRRGEVHNPKGNPLCAHPPGDKIDTSGVYNTDTMDLSLHQF